MKENEIELIRIIRNSKDPVATAEYAMQLILDCLQTLAKSQESPFVARQELSERV